MHSVDLAIHDIAHNTPERNSYYLCERIVGSKNYQTFINKANPRNRTHEFRVSEFFLLMLETNNPAPFLAMEAELRAAGVLSGPSASKSVTEAVLDCVAEGGDIPRAVTRAIADMVINDRELHEIQMEIQEERAALDALEQAVIAKHQQDSQGRS